nr:TSUP family transporter [Actibacterium sp. MT2.3-13A]
MIQPSAAHLLELVSGGLPPVTALGLAAASFIASFITVALGIGGGALLLAIMANLVPPVALIPVHGVIQLGSNLFRAGVLIRHVHWPGFAAFAGGAALGVAIGGSVVVNLPAAFVQIGVGGFVIWSVLGRSPAWLSRWSALTGMISSFLTMFFGATGVFVANYTKSLRLPRREHVATHAVMMTLQHMLKTLTFGTLGFAFGPWIGFMVLMVACGFAGTLAGKLLLDRLSDHNFKRALDAVLILISLRLVWTGARQLL